MRVLWAMIRKDLTILVRDRMGAIFTFIFPLVMAVFFGTMYSGSGPTSRALRIAVVDQDTSAASRAFVDTLAGSVEFDVQRVGRDEAREAVRLGNRTAYVLIPKGFGAAQQRLFYGEPPELEIGLDPSRKAEGGMIQGVLSRYLAKPMQELMSDRRRMQSWTRENMAGLDSAQDLDPARREALRRLMGDLDRFNAAVGDSTGGPARSSAGWAPGRFKTADIARVRRGPRNAYDVSFPQGVIWAILSSAFGFALSLVLERSRGTLMRLRVAPVHRRIILLGKAGGCFLTILIVSSALLAIATLVFRVRPSSWPLLAAAVLASAVGFVGIMMLISVMSRSQRGVSGLGWAAMMAMSMTGGGMLPLFAMPPWMQSVSQVSPVRWSIIAIEGAIWRDFTAQQMLLPCAVLVAIGLVGFVVGVRVFRWTEA